MSKNNEKVTTSNKVSKPQSQTNLNKTIIIEDVQCMAKAFEVNITKDASTILCQNLIKVMAPIFEELNKVQSGIIDPIQIRQAVLNIFPHGMNELAITRIAQVLMIKDLGLKEPRKASVSDKIKTTKVSPNKKIILNKDKKQVKTPKKRTPRKTIPGTSTKTKSKTLPRKRKRVSEGKDNVPKKKTTVKFQSKQKTPAIRKTKKYAEITEKDIIKKLKTKKPKATPSPKRTKLASKRKELANITSKKATKPPTKRKLVVSKTPLKEKTKKPKVPPKKKTKVPSKKKPKVPSKQKPLKIEPEKTPKEKGKVGVETESGGRTKKKEPQQKIVDQSKLGLSHGIEQLNACFGIKFKKDNGISLLGTKLTFVLEHLVNEINNLETETVTTVDIRQAISKIFPNTLKQLAIARISQVLMSRHMELSDSKEIIAAKEEHKLEKSKVNVSKKVAFQPKTPSKSRKPVKVEPEKRKRVSQGKSKYDKQKKPVSITGQNKKRKLTTKQKPEKKIAKQVTPRSKPKPTKRKVESPEVKRKKPAKKITEKETLKPKPTKRTLKSSEEKLKKPAKNVAGKKRKHVSQSTPKPKAAKTDSKKPKAEASAKKQPKKPKLTPAKKTEKKIKPKQTHLKKDKTPATVVAKTKEVDYNSLNQGVKKLMECFGFFFANENSSSSLVENLATVLAHIVNEVNALKTDTVRPIEIRQAVKNIFPTPLDQLAVARISQVMLLDTF